MNVFELFAKLSLDSSGYESGMSEAETKAEGFGSKLRGALGTAGKVSVAAIAAVGTAAVGAGTALVKGTGEIAAYGDNIDKMSQKLSMSAEAYQEWDAIMQHSGTSIEAMQAGMKTLASAAETGNDAFKTLGITEDELANLNQEELFSRTIEALQKMESDTQRTYVAGKLLGRGATELGALLNTSAEDTEAMRQRVHELGGVMSDDAVKAAAAYQDSLQDMTTSFSGLKRGLISEFLPGVKTVMDGLTEIFSNNTGSGLEIVSTGISSVINAMMERLPQFAVVGFGIIEALGTAIIDNIPQISEAAVQIILKVVEFLISSAPKLIDASFEIIFALADGLIEALPQLIPSVVEVILKIVEKLTEPETLLKLIDAAIQIIAAIGKGLIQAIPDLLKSIAVVLEHLLESIIKFGPQILESGVKLMVSLGEGILGAISKVGEAIDKVIDAIKEKIKGSIDAALDWGRDLISNFIDGIKNGWSELKGALGDFAQKVADFIGFSEPKEGPLSKFHTFAPDMMKLFAEGIKNNENVVTAQIEKSFNFGPQVRGAAPALASGPTTTTNTWNITVTGIDELEEVVRWFKGRKVEERMA